MTEAATLNIPVAAQRKAGPVQAWTLIFAMFLPIMAIVALAATLPTLFGRFHDLPNAGVLVPMLLTAPALCIAVISPFAGRLSDLLGRRNLLLTAMFLYGFGGLAPFLDSFWAVMAGRIVLGIAEAFILTIGNALLADYFPEKERPKWLSAQGIVGPFLAALIMFASGFLAAKGWQWPFIVYALAFPIFFAAWKYIWEPPLKKAEGHTKVDMKTFPWRTILWISLVTLVTSIIYYVYIIHFSLVLTAKGITDEGRIGVISSIVSVTVILGAYIYKRLSNRSIYFLLLLIYLLWSVGYTGISLAHTENLIVIAGWVQQVAVGMAVPTLVAWALMNLPPEHRGLGMGIWGASFFVGQFVNPLVIGFTNGVTGGIVRTYTIVGIICFVVAMAIWLPKFYMQKRASKG